MRNRFVGCALDQAAQIKLAVAEALAAHQGFGGISTETWAIVLATFAGPVIAILVSMWLTSRNERRGQLRNRRFSIFRTLLATRGQAITQDHVAALNLVEIDYYGVAKVIGAWRTYMDHLGSAPPGRAMTDSEHMMFEDRRTDLLAKLLHLVADELGFRMSDLDLKRGGYAPSGWLERDRMDTDMKLAATALFLGKTPLHVAPMTPTPAPSVAEP